MHFVIRTPNEVYMQNLCQIGEPTCPQIFDLAPFLRSIALNLPGHGSSTKKGGSPETCTKIRYVGGQGTESNNYNLSGTFWLPLCLPPLFRDRSNVLELSNENLLKQDRFSIPGRKLWSNRIFFLTESLDKSTRSSQPVSLEFYASPSFQCMKSPYTEFCDALSINSDIVDKTWATECDY